MHVNRQLNFDEFQPETIFKQNFATLSIIGKGNFGQVYKCRNLLDQGIYAVKHTKQKLKWRIEQSGATTEAKQLGSLFANSDHPNIVKYYNSWIESNQMYLVMEHCDWNLRKQSHFEEFELKCILRDVLQGLSFIHSNKLAHMDIKPENILFSKARCLYKIADFGLTRFYHTKEDEEVTEGDSRYMAPEIFENLNYGLQLDLTKLDIFSLGCTIYEIQRQRELPKCGQEWDYIRKQLARTDLVTLGYSSYLVDIVLSMLHPVPNQRPSANELLNSKYLNISDRNYLEYLKMQNGLKTRIDHSF